MSKKRKHAKKKTFFSKICENGATCTIRQCADYYKSTGEYDNMKKLYEGAITRGDICSMLQYGLYYKLVENDNDKMIYYYMMAIQNDEIHLIDKMIEEHNKKDLLEILLYGLSHNHPGSIKALNDILRETFSIQLAHKIYVNLDEENKKKFDEYLMIHNALNQIDLSSFKKIDTCGICFSKSDMIKLSCDHDLCYNCFDNFILNELKTCPFCRKETIPKGYLEKRITEKVFSEIKTVEDCDREINKLEGTLLEISNEKDKIIKMIKRIEDTKNDFINI